MMLLRLLRKNSICLIACLAGLALLAGRASEFDTDLAETASTMRIWHVADGLPSDSVTAILQTRDGYLWIGTSVGLARFDGVKFTEVKPDDAPTNNLTGITALCEDSDGHLWIGTQQNGLFQLSHGRTRHYTREQGLFNDNVTSLAADNRGQVWIGGNSGLCLWAGGHFTQFAKLEGLPDDAVASVNVARSGVVWITTRVGMCRFVNGHITPYAFQTESQGRSPEYLGAYEDWRGNLWAFGDTYLINLAEGKRFNYFRSSEPASVRIWSLCEGRDGRLWIGTSGRGLFCFEDNHFQPVILGQNRWPYDVRVIYEDREGNLWLGTSGGGLVQMRLQSVHVLRGGQGLPDSLPTTLALDAYARIYVGLQRGGLWVGQSGRFDQVGGNDGLALQHFITSLAVAQDGTIWAGTLGSGLYALQGGRGIHLTTADGLANNTVLVVCVDSETNVWASTSAGTVHRLTGGSVRRFDAAHGLPSAPVTAMIPSAAGGLWLGTRDGQILRELNDKFTLIKAVGKFGNYPVLALHENDPGWLWIGTAGGGLSCLTNGVALNWNLHNGLPNDSVAGITEDASKNLWLATGGGIFRANRADVRRAVTGPQAAMVCKQMSAVKTTPESTTVFGATRAVLTPEGRIWFATSEGVLNVDTHQTEAGMSALPVYIESVAINGGLPASLRSGALWSSGQTNLAPLKTSVDLRSLEIHFTALGFTAPEDIRFRHKLEGFDPDWVDDAGNRSARYGKLSHGKYRFHVEARAGDGPWQEASETFAFLVPTPLYFQAWAIFLYVFTGVALVAGIVRVISHRRLRNTLARMEQQQSLERERMRIARDMHDEMGSKLTKISFLSEHIQMDMESGGLIIDKVQSISEASQDLLKTMDEIVWAVNPHNDTLENLTAYLSHYAVEYFQNTLVECELKLPQEIPQHPLSSEARHNLFLTFEETLNNVLKHSAATQVKMAMAVKGQDFELKVSDNGKGFEPATVAGPTRGGRGGNGLKNMRQRLTAIGGECNIISQPGAGTVVTIQIRLNKSLLHSP